MVHCKVEGCTVNDAAALGRNNGNAFWGQPMWRMMWPPDMKREYIIEQLSKRVPLNVLLKDRDVRRHQKAVDPETGALIGYARWILPDSKVKTEIGEPEWIEAQVPDVDADQRKTFEELSETAWWDPRSDLDDLDSKDAAVKQRILAERTYLTLDYLAVHPENQRKQIATALVESGMRQAEKLGLPIFVFALKVSRAVYSRLGFKEVDRVIQDDSAFGGSGEYGAYFMVYEVPRRD